MQSHVSIGNTLVLGAALAKPVRRATLGEDEPLIVSEHLEIFDRAVMVKQTRNSSSD
jgi:hypothetical protein